MDRKTATKIRRWCADNASTNSIARQWHERFRSAQIRGEPVEEAAEEVRCQWRALIDRMKRAVSNIDASFANRYGMSLAEFGALSEGDQEELVVEAEVEDFRRELEERG